MNLLLKSVALALSAAALVTASAAAEDSCKANVRINRVISNKLSQGGTYTYELDIQNISPSHKPVLMTLESGEFPQGVRLTAHSRKITLEGNPHLPFGTGTKTLDNVKINISYDVRMSMPQPWILASDCKIK